MPKKTINRKKLGRTEVIKPQDLLKRYKDLKQFLEHNWGRIGLELQRVRKPDQVREILKLVPGVEWCTPFRDEAPLGCLRKDGSTEVRWRELGLTRQQHKDVLATEDALRPEYYGTQQQAEEAVTALKSAISQFGPAITVFPLFFLVSLLAKELAVEELIDKANRLKTSYQQAQKARQMVEERLASQEAWYARNEIIEFVVSRRYSGNPTTLAKAMAGLPEYGWLHSFRKCKTLEDESALFIEYPYQVFELLKTIVQKMKPLNLNKIEMRLRNKLLQEDTDPLLRAYMTPNWAYMKQAFAECRGKRNKRSELAYSIVGRFLDIVESPKTIAQVELAKRDHLV
jgi:hypothetical protein